MAQITSEGAKRDSQPTSDPDGPAETAETGSERQAVPDPEQEPGDNKESRAGKDMSGGRDAAGEHGDHPSLASDTDKTRSAANATGDKDVEAGEKLCEGQKSPVQGSLASSTDSAQEGSRVLGAEQREGKNVSCSPPPERTKPAEAAEHGTKRRASVELPPSDGEPLSRMDSEDRSVCD